MRRPAAALLCFLTTTGLALAAVAVSAFLLPSVVPTHFGTRGAADDWSTRTSAVTFLAAVSVGLAILFALLAWATPRMPWEWINLPGKERWAKLGRQDEVRRKLRTDLLWLGAATALLNVALTGSIVEAARGGTGRLPTWFFLSLITWLVAIAVYTAFMCLVRYRAPASEAQ